MVKKKREKDPTSLLRAELTKPVALRLRAHLDRTCGITCMLTELQADAGGPELVGTNLVRLTAQVPDSRMDAVSQIAADFLEARTPAGKELHLEERARR